MSCVDRAGALAERARSTALHGVCQLMSCVDRAGALAERARSTALSGVSAHVVC